MKIVVAVNGRFHAFNLATELHKSDHLHTLITTYPKWKCAEFGIPSSKVISLIPLEILNRSIKFLPFPKLRNYLQLIQKKLFDLVVSIFLPKDAEIFVGWSSNCLYSIFKAQKFGIKTVLERGSTHMSAQLEILQNEYLLQGLTYKPHHPEITNRELSEYEVCDYISIPSKFVKNSFV